MQKSVIRDIALFLFFCEKKLCKKNSKHEQKNIFSAYCICTL